MIIRYLCFFVLFASGLQAQTTARDSAAAADTDHIFINPERMPICRIDSACAQEADRDKRKACGDAALMKHLRNELRVPPALLESLPERCFVAVDFTIDAQGKTSELRLRRSSGNEEIDNEVMRAVRAVLKQAGDWEPSLFYDKPVSIRYMLPVRLRPRS